MKKIFLLCVALMVSGCANVPITLTNDDSPINNKAYVFGKIAKEYWNSGFDISLALQSKTVKNNIYIVANEKTSLFLMEVTPGYYNIEGMATVFGMFKSYHNTMIFNSNSFTVKANTISYLGDLVVSGKMRSSGGRAAHIFEVFKIIDNHKNTTKSISSSYRNFASLPIINVSESIENNINSSLPIQYKVLCNSLTGCGEPRKIR